MKDLEEIRLQEIEKCKSYTDKQIQYNILIYKFFRFMFSRTFMFLFYAVVIMILYMFLRVPIEIKIFSGIITHFIIFMLIDPIISNYVGANNTRKEINMLIKVNKQILQERLSKKTKNE